MHRTVEKVKIAFIIWTLEAIGGSERVVYDIVRKLNRERFEITVIGFEDGPVRHKYEELGIQVAVVSKQSKLDFGFVLKLRKILLKSKIQVINAHHFSALLYGFLATRMIGIKIIYTEHSVWQYLELGILKKIITNFLIWKADAVVAISNQLHLYYNRNPFVSNNKICSIINGIDLSRFRQIDRPGLKLALGFRYDDILIGMVANLRPEKNHKTLISAFSILCEKIANAHLILIGQDCMQGEIQQFAANTCRMDRIHFMGPREDVADLLSILDVFCLTSTHEGLPLTILEAMACGVPVVGSNVMGINEVVTDDVNGMLFKNADKEMLADRILTLLHNEPMRKRIQANGLAYVTKNYCLEEKIKSYEGLFHTFVRK